MAVKLIIISLLNEAILLTIPIKEFFLKPLFNNNLMGYMIKWLTIPCYAISFVTCIVSIFFFAISIINKQNEKPLKAQTKIKVGIILLLVSITAMAVAVGLFVIFK